MRIRGFVSIEEAEKKGSLWALEGGDKKS